MTGKVYFILGSTFLMGILSGMFLYVSTFAPAYVADDVTSRSAISIDGQMYGGCLRGNSCASFRFADDYKYQYLVSDDGQKENGKLPAEVAQKVFEQLEVSELERFSSPNAIRDCVSFVDGVDYTYTIVFNKQTYILDTCKTNFNTQTELFASLSGVWQYMQNPTTTYPAIIEKGLGGYIVDRFKNSDE